MFGDRARAAGPASRTAPTRTIHSPLWRTALGVLIISALLTAFSESFYWYSGGTDYPARVLFYVIPTTALLWALSTPPAAGWPAVVLAGGVYGFVTEGVLTPIVYGGFPFDPFAISYTSLAWHALIGVTFGLVLLHRALARGSLVTALCLICLFGAFWGAWAIGLRLPPDDDEELAGISALVGDVTVATFALYTVAVTAVVALCHGLLGRLVRASDLAPPRGWRWAMAGVGLLWFAILIVPGVPWAPVELAALLLVCRWGLIRLARSQATGRSTRPPDVLVGVTAKFPWPRLGLLAALPATGIVTYAALVGASLGDDTIRLIRDSLVWLQMTAGWVLFGWALFRASRATTEIRSTRPSGETLESDLP